MSVTPRTSGHAPPPARPTSTGSSAGFILVALGAVVAAVGVMRLEVQGAPWPVVQPVQPISGLQAPRLLTDMRQARGLRQDASSEAAAGARLYRAGDPSGQ